MFCKVMSHKRKYVCTIEHCLYESDNYRSFCHHLWEHNQTCELCKTNLDNVRQWKKHIRTKKHNVLLNSASAGMIMFFHNLHYYTCWSNCILVDIFVHAESNKSKNTPLGQHNSQGSDSDKADQVSDEELSVNKLIYQIGTHETQSKLKLST